MSHSLFHAIYSTLKLPWKRVIGIWNGFAKHRRWWLKGMTRLFSSRLQTDWWLLMQAAEIMRARLCDTSLLQKWGMRLLKPTLHGLLIVVGVTLYYSTSLSLSLSHHFSTFLIGLIDFESTKRNLFTEKQDLYEVALNLWNRAAIQGNVDARVKMGDYHFYGLGLPTLTGSSKTGSTGQEALTTSSSSKEEEKETSSSQTKPSDSSSSWWGSSFFSSVPWLKSLFNSVGQVLVLVPPQPVGNRSPNYEKAALYYQVAAESQHSALALWNLGYMHELGVGVNRVMKKGRFFWGGRSCLTF
jgi:hypothetical protein